MLSVAVLIVTTGLMAKHVIALIRKVSILRKMSLSPSPNVKTFKIEKSCVLIAFIFMFSFLFGGAKKKC